MTTTAQAITVSIMVNGARRQADIEPGTLLVEFLRDTLGLTGTKVGCESAQCGACTVLLDGVSVKSCAILAVQADASVLLTVEGLAAEGLSPLQESMRENHAVQCGFCTPGILLSMTDLLSRNAHPAEAEIRTWLDGTMCRCGAYQNVVLAVQGVAGRLLPGGE